MKVRLIVLCLASVLVQSIEAQEHVPRAGLGKVKEWLFHSQNGEVRVTLTAHMTAFQPPVFTSLSFDAQKTESAPTIREEAEFLGVVFREMPSLGYSPLSIRTITLSIRESELRGRIEQAIVNSGKWRSCLGLKYCSEAQVVVDEFLRSENAYRQFDGVLQQFGLTRKKVRADDVTVSLPSGSQLDGERHSKLTPQVSCWGQIVIDVDLTKL